ncbi:MAG TPA: tetratricopeptide repeat protein, partial [Candidatus Ozemobacteraceae bacterium]|nr:tetratricopeptide repeat protein [Candidatus Ozemobacteraceae bacterium]
MNRMQFTRLGSYPGFAFSLGKGALAWQDWMTDFLVASSMSFDGAQMAIISFLSGQILHRAELSAEAAELLRAGSGYALFSQDFTPDVQFESLLVKAEPYDFTGQFWQGVQHQMQGSYEQAVAAYQQAIAANPLLPRAHNLLGLCLRQLQRLEDAEQAYLQETTISPDSPDAFANLGVLCVKTGRTDEARGHFERSLDRDQFYLNALLQLSRLLQSASDTSAPLLKALHLRLLAGHADQPSVQELLQSAATAAEKTLPEYISSLQSTLDLDALRVIKRLETLRQNGAMLALLSGYTHLLERIPPHPGAAAFLMNWVRQRLTTLAPRIPDFLKPLWHAQTQVLYQRWPDLTSSQKASAPTDTPADGPTGALSADEFYELLLQEVILDGQVQPEEVQLVGRAKNLLKIDQPTHDRLWLQVRQRRQASLQSDDGRAFDRRL